MDEIKIIVVGDSIAEGLGVTGHCYADLIGMRLGEASRRAVAVTNLARTGTQVTDTLRLMPKMIRRQPDAVIIAHGVTEAIVRPCKRAMRLVPSLWRQKGRLDPRPYFSRRPHKRLYQKIESALRWRLKVLLIRKFGGENWLSESDYHDSLKRLAEHLLERTPAKVIFLTPSMIDETFFPGSQASLRAYEGQAARVAASLRQSERVSLCRSDGRLVMWDDYFADHFHPNASGHRKIADSLIETLLSAGLPCAEERII